MPRRPRPAARRPPQYAGPSATVAPTLSAARSTKSAPNLKRKPQPASESEASASDSASDGFFQEDDRDEGSSSSVGEDEHEDADAEPDAPRVAQWVDEEELDEMSDEGSESEPDEEVDESHLEADLQTLSFGALRKAQKTLANVRAYNESESEDDNVSDVSEPEGEPFAPTPRPDKGKEREEPRPEKKAVPKRSSKHAPTEMSSKRPVPRARLPVVEKAAPRDPRFLHVTGELDNKRFHSQYGFLSELHEEEMKTLKDNLKRARKLLINSPRDLREERAAEVERLERALKRAESAVNKDRREKVELDALGQAGKAEREKRKEGKGAWYMKDADKKALLLRAKYDALAAAGGKGAVRKAIEKRQKKVSQKEKKKRPFAPGQTAGSRTGGHVAGGGPARGQRPYHGSEGPRKRPRVS